MTISKETSTAPSRDSAAPKETDDGEYKTLHGCLVLTALTVLCGIIFIACILLFGNPPQ